MHYWPENAANRPYIIGKFTHKDSTGKQTEYFYYDAGALIYIWVNTVKEKQLDKKDALNLVIQAEHAKIKALLLKQHDKPVKLSKATACTSTEMMKENFE